MRTFVDSMFVGLCTTLFFGCSNARLTVPAARVLAVQNKGQFCLKPPDTNNAITKFMFVIDKSGSNVSSGTDPNNKYRADAIQVFFNGTGDDGIIRSQNPNVKWGYIAFQGSSANAYINGGDDQSPIYVGMNDNPNDVTAMNTALDMQRNNADVDSTPYHSALGLATKAIQNDRTAHPDEQSEYVIFFMSDGMPTDYNGWGAEKPAGQEAFDDVDALMNTDLGHVTFSTAYYGPKNQDAANGLQTMAQHGNGKFVDLNANTNFKIDDMLNSGKSAEPYGLTNFMVFNVNSAISIFTGEFCVDSDGDGLCDEDEITLSKTTGKNFDPQNRYSFGDGYGDYFHYLESKNLAVLKPCQDRSDDDHDLLTACEEAFMMMDSTVNGTVVHRSGNPKDPDTDRDGYIDGIEWLMLHKKSAALDANNVIEHPTGVPLDIATLLHRHLNPETYNPNRPASQIYDYQPQVAPPSPKGEKCYTYSQPYLETFHTLPVGPAQTIAPEYAHREWDNMILIYYIEKTDLDPYGPGVYRYSIQPVAGDPMLGSNHVNVTVSDSVFQTYVVPAK